MIDGAILCVDDDPTVLRALRALLVKLGSGAQIEIAESGAEALEIEEDLRDQGKDLAVVISDFIMPGMHGDELLIKLHEANPEAVKIMLTGQSDFEGVKRAINQANLYRFLEKPFDNDDFILTVKSAYQAFNQERELKRQNSELKELNTDLERMLAKINEQQEDLAKAEAKATISTLVASVSHELGTPVGNSMMSATMLGDLSKRFAGQLESGSVKRSELTQFVESVMEGSKLLQRNLQRASGLLHNFKQVAADQASEQRRRFELAAAVMEIIETMGPSLKNKPHKVVVEIPAGIGMDSLPGALGQVVINLINNAYLHAFEGRSDGVLRITAEAANVGEGEDASPFVQMLFADNGVGISPENLARLTEPFFSTKIGKGGTGLGMSIVENLVTKTLGGTLRIESTVGVGTRFHIGLPCILPAAKADAGQTAKATEGGPPEKPPAAADPASAAMPAATTGTDTPPRAAE